jgi:mRNA interferase RelE/StbE
MRRYRVAISAGATAAVRDVHPDLKRAIRHALEALATNPERGDELRCELAGLRRYRVRRFRIVYEVDTSARVIRILAIGHRRNVYEEIADVRRRR